MGATLTQAPRLGNGGIGYAAWRMNMDVFLQRNGAENIHSVAMLENKWLDMSQRSATWQQEALDEAMALVLGDVSSSTSSSSSGSDSSNLGLTADDADGKIKTASPGLSDAIKAGRKVVSSTVERSRRVFGAIYSALPDELKAQAGHIAQGWAYGLWYWLETKFQSTEEDSVGELLGQWSALRQDDSESFDTYRARVNKLHALLVHAKEKPSVRMYSHTLLDRLQPRYKAAVLALRASGQLKDADKIAWDTVTAFINAHEREEARIDGEAAVIMAARGAGGKWQKSHSWSKASDTPASAAPQGTSKRTSHTEENSRRGDRRPMSEIQCYGCEKFGHFARNCPQHKNDDRAEGRRSGGRAFGVGEHRQDRREASQEREQVKAVLSENRFAVLHGVADRNSEDGSSSFKEWNGAFTIKVIRPDPKKFSMPIRRKASVLRSKSLAKQAHRAETDAKNDSPVVSAASQQGLSTLAWGMDSMASLHVSGNRALFTEMSECKPQRVEVADGSTVEARHIGNVLLSVATTEGQVVLIAVKGVYYHERFSANLLSWNVLRAMGWEFHSTKKDTFVITPGGSKVMLSTHGRVSVMKNSGRVGKADPTSRVYALGSVVSPNVTDLMRLHEKLGHMGFDRMLRLIEQQTTVDVKKVNVTKDELQEARRLVLDCKACVQGKGTRSAFGHRGLDKGVGPGETLHMDTFQVPMENEGRNWLEYGLAVTDPYTSHRWFEHLDSKDKAADAIIRIVQNAQTQLNCRVKRLYADGGTEFINHTLKSFCVKQGIELHYPPARTQQLNGVAENSVRVIKDGMRSMMIHSFAPRRFWSYAGKHGAYVWNRTHTSDTTKKTPYEMMFGKKPSMRSWGVFGCDAYLHVPKGQRDVFAPKMDPCIYLGHDPVQNCATVYLLRTRKIIRSRDVSFRETSFTHGIALTAGDSRVLDLLQDGRDHAGLLVPPESDEAAPQGGQEIPAPQEESNEYEVDRILAQRTHRKHGLQFLVKWSTNETTWEPADMMTEDSPEAVEEFLAANPPPSGPRRSTRHRVTERIDRTEVVDASDSDGDREEAKYNEQTPRSDELEDSDTQPDEEESEVEVPPQVHLAMSALRDFHSPLEETRSTTEVIHAVSSGVALLEEQTPHTVREAKASPDAKAWRAGMDKEMASCMEKKVWSYVRRADVPRGKVILRPKWVFKTKTDENGQVTDRKARITPRGFEQKPGSDYFEVFAPTGMFKSMRLNLSLAAKWDHELDQLDIPVAFLNAPIDEEIFMEIPEGFRQGKEHLVCVLNKALYGLKQSPRNWYLLIRAFIVDQMGFKASVSDPCLFFRRSRTGRLMMLFLFVDDFQVSYHLEDAAEWNELKAKLVQRFNTKDMGPSKWILGMSIKRNRAARTIELDQELYITKALEKYGLAECKVADTPEVVGAAHQEPSEQQQKPTNRQRYMEIVGTLMYAAISTRLDIGHAVHYLACHMLAPTELHMAAAERVLRYLAGTKEVGLMYGSRNGEAIGDSRGRNHIEVDICAFSDADWANNRVDRKSVTGWVAKLNGDPVSWASKKQRTVALSTCEAELYAKAAAIQEVLWLRGLMKELGLHTQAGTVHGDNQSAIAIAKNGIKGERTKHVDVKYHFVTECVERGEVQLKWVSTHQQQADIFTKALAAPVFHQFRKQLMTR